MSKKKLRRGNVNTVAGAAMLTRWQSHRHAVQQVRPGVCTYHTKNGMLFAQLHKMLFSGSSFLKIPFP
jgi:hypothetical protein